MSATKVVVRGLPDAPLDAAADFTQNFLPQIRAAMGGGVAMVFDPADHAHETWRRAMVEELAREAAPARVNAIVGTDEAAIAATLAYLDSAPGVTGQVFTTNDLASASR